MTATGAQTVADVARGATTVADVAESALDRIRQREADVRAFRWMDEAAVRARAKELDETPEGALRGLTVAVKDVIDTADLPTEYGSPIYAGHRPTADAAVVARLREVGALVLGKSESTEFAMFQPTRTRNPHDLERTPGGSSSGSAAAVADGMAHAALGTQTAGSVLRPASYCGVYGYKPRRGWASTQGVWELARSLDTIGLFGRSVADLRLLYDALAVRSRDRPSPRRTPVTTPLSVTILPAKEWGETLPEVATALEVVGERLRLARIAVEPMQMPATWRDLPEAHRSVMAVEVAAAMTRRLGPRVDDISDSAREIVEQGRRTSAADYLSCLDARDAALRTVHDLAGSFDLVVAPSALGVAPMGLDSTGDPVMCRPWTLLGLPAANLPAHRTREGLPVGIQVLALSADDRTFLERLTAVESAILGQEQSP